MRLANVITLSEHRGQGHGTMLVLDIVAWTRSIAADLVDLSATPAGQPLYEKPGFTMTSAPAHEAPSEKGAQRRSNADRLL